MSEAPNNPIERQAEALESQEFTDTIDNQVDQMQPGEDDVKQQTEIMRQANENARTYGDYNEEMDPEMKKQLEEAQSIVRDTMPEFGQQPDTAGQRMPIAE